MNNSIDFINKFKISIISIKEYKNLIKEKLSKAIIYSIILSLIIGILQGFFSLFIINTAERTIKDIVLSEEFSFTFQNGKLDFKNSPIKIEEGRTILYIDTNISLDNLDSIRNILVHKDISFAIVSDGISSIFDGERNDIKFTDNNTSQVIDNETILKSLDILKIVKYISFIFSIILIYIKFMLNTFILSILGVFIDKINNTKLGYETIFKVSIYASTLPIVFSLILPVGLIGFLISGVYLILVLNNLKS